MRNRIPVIIKVLCVYAGLVLLLAIYAHAQTASKKYEPTEIQALRLQVKKKDAQLAQQAFAIAQAQFQTAIAALNTEGDAIKKENGWPATVQLDVDKLDFSEPPPPPTAKPTPPAAK